MTQEQLDSEKLNQVAVKGSSLNKPIVKPEAKVKIEPGIKQEDAIQYSPEREVTIKQEVNIKQEPIVKREVESVSVKEEPIPTPPTTPHKPKQAAKLKKAA